MKLDLDIKDFITENHQLEIQSKISTAIGELDFEKFKTNLQKQLDSPEILEDYAEEVVNGCWDELSEFGVKFLKKKLKEIK